MNARSVAVGLATTLALATLGVTGMTTSGFAAPPPPVAIGKPKPPQATVTGTIVAIKHQRHHGVLLTVKTKKGQLHVLVTGKTKIANGKGMRVVLHVGEVVAVTGQPAAHHGPIVATKIVVR
ncbi:hypothetical protein [Fodinicola acaciae]|uniref:hypothetical protein n=1 Tax=Fodinicola acaciae TaxID=2681555 RepID=UPI0013D4E8B5|nr:hypothetical protein [Fodinicola acaciae]